MDRRDFLKKSLVLGGTAGIAIATGDAEAKEALAGAAGMRGSRCPRKADILIKAGELYDGVNPIPVTSDIAIKGERIVYVGKANPKIESRCKAAKVIDATGYVVCPGFIDPHCHLESLLLKTKTNEPYLRMGVTTVIAGMCGGSQYPLNKYFGKLESQGIGTNTASFTGHNTVRSKVMGQEDRFATKEEVAKMQELVQKDLDDGSFGLSSGLYYVPGCFSEGSEVVELCKTIAPVGGIYTTHVRNENKYGIGLYESILEALNIGRQAGVQVNISHIKCLGKGVWYQSDKVIEAIEKCQKEGMKVTADQYPYLASGLGLASAITPSWSRDGGVKGLKERMKDPELLAKIKAEMPGLIDERGGADTIILTAGAKEYSGKTLAVAAKMLGLNDVDAALKLINDLNPSCNTFVMNEKDVVNYMTKPWVMSCSDGTFGSHPRAAGTYAELIQKYVVEKGVLPLSAFIRRSTGLVAETYRIKDRGVIREGAFADVTIFRPAEVRANATYTAAKLLANGFKNVIVNGQVAVENDNYLGTLSGKVIRRGVDTY